MDQEYVQKVQEWVILDNKLLKNKEQIQSDSEKKRELETDILDYITKNKLDNLSLTISDGKIKFSKRVTTQSLSMKTLKDLLEQYFTEKNSITDVNTVINYISSKLEKKTQVIMKRELD
jgi:hypothetical protein